MPVDVIGREHALSNMTRDWPDSMQGLDRQGAFERAVLSTTKVSPALTQMH